MEDSNFFYVWKIELTLLVIFSGIYAFSRYIYSYWERKGIRSAGGVFPFGSILDLLTMRKAMSQYFYDLYYEMDGLKYFGMYAFHSPLLVVRDVDVIKNIVVKDFSSFHSRGMYYNEAADPCSAHLFALEGAEWRNLRTKLSPAYSSGKMKYMYGTMKGCATKLGDYLDECRKTAEVFDFREVIKKYGLNVISSTAIGIEGHNMKEENRFSELVAQVTSPTMVQGYRFFMALIANRVAGLFKIRLTPKEVGDYFVDTVKNIVDEREHTNKTRHDFIQLMVDLRKAKDVDAKKNGEGQQGLTVLQMAAQALLFILAGHDTSSSGSIYTLYELALNPDIQDKLIDEIDNADPDISYEKLLDLPYLDMVVQETLRKHPPVGFLQRQSNADYVLPGNEVLASGTVVIIPVRAIQRDPKYFPDPEKYDPERFNKECPSHEVVPYSYMPFGEGPRFCIGARFAKLEIKLALFTLLSKFRFDITEKSATLPDMETTTFVLQPKGGMWLRVSRRK